MKYMIKSLLLLMIMTTIGCSWDTVSPTQRGKILTTAGYQKDILPPGKYTLIGRDQLVTLDVNTNTYTERVSIILKDKLILVVDVRFRGRISSNHAILNSMFSDVTPGADMNVSFDEVYAIYGKMAVRNVTRSIISEYTIDDVHENYKRISPQIQIALLKELANTPLEISKIALGAVKYPDVIINAITEAKERELSIKKEEAQALINLTKKKNEKALAEADYAIEMIKAGTVRDANKVMGQGITNQLLALKRLETLEVMSNSGNTIFMPMEAMANFGAQNRMFSK